MARQAQRDVFTRLLVQAREDAGFTQRQLAKLIEVSPGTVAQWEMGETAPRFETVAPLEDALDVQPGTFAHVLGFVMAAAGDPPTDVVGAIEQDPDITDDGRELLITLYRTLRKQARR